MSVSNGGHNNTIIPIFAVIGLGAVARKKGFLQDAFLTTANRLVYYLAIPAMIFRAIAGVSLEDRFDPMLIGVTLTAVLLVFVSTWIGSRWIGMAKHRRGTFVQSVIHGNLGYIGLAVAFYFMGSEGLVRAGIIAGFLMIFQNLLAVIVLQANAETSSTRPRLIRSILGNPVIVSALAGILFSVSGVPTPLLLDRCLKIIGDLALPMALLIIGASLNFSMLSRGMGLVMVISVLKLIVLPALGLWGFRLFNASYQNLMAALVLLAAPSATLTYVMARELSGDADLAVSAISATTLLSALTYTGWLAIIGRLSF